MQNNFMIMVLLICLTACTDIFEKNLEKQTVILLSPANNLQTELSSHTFWWEEIKQARNYNLQVVKGSFTQVQALVLDTHIVDEKFSFCITARNPISGVFGHTTMEALLHFLLLPCKLTVPTI